ncbi:MAG: DinB family protein [Gemmatimonadota bacterium]
MSKLDTVRRQSDYLLDVALETFDRAVLLIPADWMDFRPTPWNMSAAELSHHVPQVLFCLTRGTERGEFREADFQLLPFALDQATSPEQIVAYSRRVRRYVRQAVARFTEADLDRMVRFPFGMRGGFESMMLAFEEAMHHRGQLMVYLRLMGREPPRQRDFI